MPLSPSINFIDAVPSEEVAPPAGDVITKKTEDAVVPGEFLIGSCRVTKTIVKAEFITNSSHPWTRCDKFVGMTSFHKPRVVAKFKFTAFCSASKYCKVQGSSNRLRPGLVNFVAALA